MRGRFYEVGNRRCSTMSIGEPGGIRRAPRKFRMQAYGEARAVSFIVQPALPSALHIADLVCDSVQDGRMAAAIVRRGRAAVEGGRRWRQASNHWHECTLLYMRLLIERVLIQRDPGQLQSIVY